MTMSEDLLSRARAASGAARKAPPGPRVPVPPQRPYEPFTELPDKIEFGMVRPCPRCHGYQTKRWKKLGYHPDPNGGVDREGNPRRCVKCNGLGYVPNVGT